MNTEDFVCFAVIAINPILGIILIIKEIINYFF